ncbi:MAG: putative quinol monooxygenase [Coriobacteriia bacterium]|nr:putative quinol monooxygenase [Coriobacteriia bacterium]
MSITVNILYHGRNGAAQAFAREMIDSGTVAAIRAEDGNEAYEYYTPLDDPEAILLIDRWRNQAAIDAHHASPMMKTIAELRDAHDLHMEVRRFTDLDSTEADAKFIRH